MGYLKSMEKLTRTSTKKALWNLHSGLRRKSEDPE